MTAQSLAVRLHGHRRRCAFALAFVLALVATAALAAPARAGIHLVDPNDPLAYTQIQPAIDASLPNDIIVVRPLSDPQAIYDAFVIDNIGTRAVVGVKELGSVRVAGATIGSLALGEVAILRALDLTAPSDTPALVISSPDGSIRIEDCTLAGGDGELVGPAPGVTIDSTFSAVLTHCTITGGTPAPGNVSQAGAPAVVSKFSHSAVRGSTLTGGNGADSLAVVAEAGSRGGAAFDCLGGKILLTNTTFQGGTGGLPGCDPLLECDCGPLGDGGDAITMKSTILTVEACVLVPGAGPAPPCGLATGGNPGQPIVAIGGVVQEIQGDHHEYYMSSPCQTPVLADFHAEGVIWEAFYLTASTFPLHKYMFKYDGELMLGTPNLMDLKLLRIFDVDPAIHDTTHPIPPPPPGVDSIIGYTQAIFVNTLAPSEVHIGDMSTFLYIGYGFPDPPPPPGP